MPVILGPDGPSLGGFVCPAVVAAAERWKLGQLRAGRPRAARAVDAGAGGRRRRPARAPGWPGRRRRSSRWPGRRGTRAGRRAGRRDDARARPGARRRRPPRRHLPPGRRPVPARRVRPDDARPRAAAARARARPVGRRAPRRRRRRRHRRRALAARAGRRRRARPSTARSARSGAAEDELRRRRATRRFPSRIVHLPLSWDDPATREAIERYMHGVRADAPWCPWNIEFIRRINGLDTRRRRAPHRVRRVVPRARARRRVPRRAGGHAARPPPPPRDHEVQPGPHVDAGERRRHRRRLPVHLRHGGPGRLPVRRAHRAGVEPRPPRPALRPSRGCCAPFDQLAVPPGRAPTSCSSMRAAQARGRARRSTIEDDHVPPAPTTGASSPTHADEIAAFQRRAAGRVRRRAGGVGREPGSSAR